MKIGHNHSGYRYEKRSYYTYCEIYRVWYTYGQYGNEYYELIKTVNYE